MRIGFIRHFPVEEALPRGWRTAAELMQWTQRYNASPAIVGNIDLGEVPWTTCVSSDLERALVTANTAFAGTVEISPLLREVEFNEFQTGALRLPVWAWRLVLRAAWMSGHRSQRSARDGFRQRVTAVADMLESRPGDTLVVSHAGTLLYLGAELRRRGFAGPKLGIARHAELYVFSREDRG